MTNYLKEVYLPAIDAKAGDSREFLEEYVQQWKNFSLFLFQMTKLVSYLDKYHLKTANQ